MLPGGPSSTSTVSTIWAFDPVTKHLLTAGHLQVPVSHAAVAVPATPPGSLAANPAAPWSPRSRCCARTVPSEPPAHPARAHPISGPGCSSPTAATTGSYSWTTLCTWCGSTRRCMLRGTHCASTSLMTRSSSTTARPSSPTRSRTRPSSRSGTPRARSSGPTAIPAGRDRPGTCTSPTTPICLKTAGSPWPTPTTAGYWCSTRTTPSRTRSAPTASACVTLRPRWARRTGTRPSPTATC